MCNLELQLQENGNAVMKTLIVLGAGSECVYNIRHAKELGYRVVVLDYDPEAPGILFADEYLPLNPYDEENSTEGIKKWLADGNHADGVICVALDAPRTVAALEEVLGKHHLSMETAHLATDKVAMKTSLARAGIPVPWFKEIYESGEIRSYLAPNKPLVIKPVDSRGARGVRMLAENSNLEEAFADAKQHSASGRVMIEEFLEGQQISSEGLMIDGEGFILGLSDRNYEFLNRYAPHIIENGGDLPSHLPAYANESLRRITAEAARALGLMNGPVKGDLIWHDGKAYVIEIAARHSGGYLVTHELPWNTGVDLLAQSYALAVGDRPDKAILTPTQDVAVCQRYLFPNPGRVLSVEGVEEAAAMPGVEYVEVRVRPGDIVKPITSHALRPGVIMTKARSRGEARRIMKYAMRTVRIITVAEQE